MYLESLIDYGKTYITGSENVQSDLERESPANEIGL